MQTGQLMVWRIDGEDLIVSYSERDMMDVYRDYHGESIRGHDRELIGPDKDIELTDDGDNVITMKAREFATSRGYYAAYR